MEKVQAIGGKNSRAIQIKKPKNRHLKRNRTAYSASTPRKWGNYDFFSLASSQKRSQR